MCTPVYKDPLLVKKKQKTKKPLTSCVEVEGGFTSIGETPIEKNSICSWTPVLSLMKASDEHVGLIG